MDGVVGETPHAPDSESDLLWVAVEVEDRSCPWAKGLPSRNRLHVDLRRREFWGWHWQDEAAEVGGQCHAFGDELAAVAAEVGVYRSGREFAAVATKHTGYACRWRGEVVFYAHVHGRWTPGCASILGAGVWGGGVDDAVAKEQIATIEKDEG